MKTLCILARYGRDKYSDAPSEVQKYYREVLPGVDYDLLVVDNALPVGVHDEDGGYVVIGGTATHREFSGWDDGVRHVGARIHDYDLVHIVTAAFQALKSDFVVKMTEEVLEAAKSLNCVVGQIDSHRDPVVLNGRETQCWIRSSFFFLKPEAVLGLGSFISFPTKVGLFSGDPNAPFAASAPLDKEYQTHIINWLTGKTSARSEKWHSCFDLGPDTLEFFEDKTLAILNEHALSLRLEAQGVPMIDATYLNRVVSRKKLHKLTKIPSFDKQTAFRRKFMSGAYHKLRRRIRKFVS